MLIKVYQIDPEKDKNKLKFSSFSNNQDVKPEIYKLVYFGYINSFALDINRNLEEVWRILNTKRVPTFQGHSLSVSDVIEIYAEDEPACTSRSYYFCDSIGFKKLDSFDTSKTAAMEGLRVVYVEPMHKPLDINILPDLTSLQNAVGGLIEPIPNGYDDECIFVGNEEAKLRNMKGNIHLNYGGVLAGPFFVIGDDAENGEFRSLTEAEVSRYMQMFSEPENISDDETQSDMGFKIFLD